MNSPLYLVVFLYLGIFLALFIYHFFIYSGRRTDKRNLSFSLLNLSFIVIIFARIIYPMINGSSALGQGILLNLSQAVFFMAFIFFAYTLLHMKELFRVNLILIVIAAIMGIVCITVFLATGSSVLSALIYDISSIVIGLGFVLYLVSLLVRKKKSQRPRLRIGIAGILIAIVMMALLGILGHSLGLNQLEFFFLFSFPGVFITLLFVYILTSSFNREHRDLAELKDGLETQVKKRTLELEREKEEKVHFYTTFAHEMKTPLTIISLYLDTYTRGIRFDDALGVVQKYVGKLKTDMSDLLDMETYELENSRFARRDVFDLSDCVSNIMRLFLPLSDEKNIELFFPSTTGCFIKANRHAVEKICEMVLAITIKYMAPKGRINISLREKSDDTLIRLEARPVLLTENTIQQISSVRLKGRMKNRSSRDLGWSIFLIRSILTSLGGTLSVDGIPKKGLSFELSFPGHTSARNSQPVASSPPPLVAVPHSSPAAIVDGEYTAGRKTVLLVDDNEDLLYLLKENIEKEYNAFFALNGRHALRKLELIPLPDLIVSDIMMDIMDGYELYDKILEHHAWRHIPFIFLTAKGTESDRIKGLHKGVLDYIVKPFSIDELAEKIKSILSNIENQRMDSREKTIQGVIDVLEPEEEKDRRDRVNECARQFGFSRRELEAASLLTENLSYQKMSKRLRLSVKTVSTLCHRIYKKTGVNNRVGFINRINQQ